MATMQCPKCGQELRRKEIAEDPEPWWDCPSGHEWRVRDGGLVPDN